MALGPAHCAYIYTFSVCFCLNVSNTARPSIDSVKKSFYRLLEDISGQYGFFIQTLFLEDDKKQSKTEVFENFVR